MKYCCLAIILGLCWIVGCGGGDDFSAPPVGMQERFSKLNADSGNEAAPAPETVAEPTPAARAASPDNAAAGAVGDPPAEAQVNAEATGEAAASAVLIHARSVWFETQSHRDPQRNRRKQTLYY